MSNPLYVYRGTSAMGLGNYYTRHIDAMTSESLHSKSEIAEELGARDREIDILKKKVSQLEFVLTGELDEAENS